MSNDIQLGAWVSVPHPFVVELLSHFPFNWICMDMEHSPTSREDLNTSVALIQKSGRKAFARIAENQMTEAKFPLDIGVDGIIVPMVNSAEEARRAVDNCFYPPVGKRGIGLARAHTYGFEFDKYLEKSKELTLIVQIEHINAVKEIKAILDIPQVAGVFIGPYDMSGSMGITGQLEHPDLLDAVKKTAEATKAMGKILGAHVMDPDAAKVEQYAEMGYDFIGFSTDMLLLGHKIKSEFEKMGRI